MINEAGNKFFEHFMEFMDKLGSSIVQATQEFRQDLQRSANNQTQLQPNQRSLSKPSDFSNSLSKPQNLFSKRLQSYVDPNQSKDKN